MRPHDRTDRLTDLPSWVRAGAAAAVPLRPGGVRVRAAGGAAEEGEDHPRAAAQVRHHHHLRRSQAVPHAGIPLPYPTLPYTLPYCYL